MKKSLFILIILAVLALTLSACTINVVTGSGRLITNTRNVGNFDSLLFAGIGDVTIVQGTSEGLKIEAEDNIMDKIITEVRGTQLYIGFERANWQDIVRPTKGIKLTLNVKDLNSMEISGVGSLNADSFRANNLTIKVGGAGNITLHNLTSTGLTAIMSGAGNVDLSGSATSLDATLSGVGNFSCGNLQVQTADIRVTGAGGATVWASNSLDVNITGAGSVSYYGSPSITKNIAGVGVVNELGSK
jgi:predicted small secreted protein